MTENNTIQGWCLKCKQKRAMKNHQIVEMKTGKKRHSGECVECNTKMSKLLSREETAANLS